MIICMPGGGDFAGLKTIFEHTFFPTKQGRTNLPQNSVVFISLTSMLLTCPVQMYVIKLVEIINTLVGILE